MEGSILWGAGWTSWAVGTWKWKAVRPGQKTYCGYTLKSDSLLTLVCQLNIIIWALAVQLMLNNLCFVFLNSPLPQDDKGKFNFDQSKVVNPENGEPVSLCLYTLLRIWAIGTFVDILWKRNKVTLGETLLFRCPVGIGAVRLGTVNSPRLLPPMKNVVLNVLGSICVSTSRCSGIPYIVL